MGMKRCTALTLIERKDESIRDSFPTEFPLNREKNEVRMSPTARVEEKGLQKEVSDEEAEVKIGSNCFALLPCCRQQMTTGSPTPTTRFTMPQTASASSF